MSHRGFTLVELLVATVIALLVSAGALMLAGAARTSFTVEPASSDAVRRLREGAAVLAAAIAGAGGERGIGDDTTALSAFVPAVRLAGVTAENEFSELAVIRGVRGGLGRLAADQPGPAGSLMLETAAGLCPQSGELCGFSVGDVAVAFDARGHFDVLIVGAVSEPLARLTPRAPLSYAYRAGAWVVAARQERLLLAPQPGGARTLTRITAAGAREPIVDGVTRLRLAAWGDATAPSLYASAVRPGYARYGLPPLRPDAADPEGIFTDGSHCMASQESGTLQTTLAARAAQEDGLALLAPSELEDGPWCPHDDAPDRFDADWFRVRRVDLDLHIEALAAEFRGPTGELFSRGGTAAHDAPRWVRDRVVRFSVAVGQ